MPEDPILTEEERNVDVVICGTGLTESLLAAAVARYGRRVLHIDKAQAYGGNWRALNLAELEAWIAEESDPPAVDPNDVGAPDRDLEGLQVVDLNFASVPSCFQRREGAFDPFSTRSEEDREALKAELLKRPGAWCLDLVPRLLFGRSDMVDVLVESGVARYLEFQGLRSARVLTPTGLVAVPLTKSDIFQDPVLTLPEKRMLMRFITSMAPFVGSLAFASPAQLGVDQAHKVKGPEAEAAGLDGVDMDAPWCNFLQQQKLSARLQEFLTYAICLWDWEQPKGGSVSDPSSPTLLSTREGLACLGRFVSSLGVHGKGTAMPLLYPMYGASEIAQGFTRMCALHRGIYALRTFPTKFLASQDKETGAWKAEGIVTQRGEVVRAKAVISSADHFKPASKAEAAGASSASMNYSKEACKRMIVVIKQSLFGEEGINLCVVPPSATDPPLENVVQVLQLDWATGACPRDYHILQLSQAVTLNDSFSPSESTSSDFYTDLDRALKLLLSSCLAETDRESSCVYRCAYLHRPRNLESLRRSTSEVHECVAGSCSGGSLSLSEDPAAVPQLLVGPEVPEAKGLFLGCPGFEAAPSADDFLKKPSHVAMEEQAGSLEDLEHFNQEMQNATAESPEQKDPAAAVAAEAPAAAAAASAAGTFSPEPRSQGENQGSPQQSQGETSA